MSTSSHALYSELYHDLVDSIGKDAADSIRSGYNDWPDISYRERASSSLWSSLFKKFEGRMTKQTKDKALAKFLQVNSACGTWELRDDLQPCDDLLLGEFRKLIWKFWHHMNLYPITDSFEHILSKGGVGPGAAIGSPGGDFYTKLFSSRLSCTNRVLYLWYSRYTNRFAEWSNAEKTRLLNYGEAEIVDSNRLSFVPKNDDTSRSICTEPVLNMYYQLGFGEILNERLRNLWGINLEVQQFKNRELARIGSLDGSLSTIDLSSASDSISLRMLEWALPSDFLRWLKLFRCPKSKLPDGTPVGLNMVSTMGNGYTFPLQTMLFTAIVLSAFRCDGLAPVFPRGNSEGNFGVNGDDIVVPTRITAKVLRLLHLLGFQTNKEKTFVEGPFRESCGGDYFNGRNLRGVYIKTLRAPQDYYAVINQLNLFSTRTGILLPRTVQLLLRKVKYLPVPLWENDDAGIKVPFPVIAKRLKGSSDLCGSIHYTAWVSDDPPSIAIQDSCLVVPSRYKRREFNLSGLFLSFLQGSVNSHSIPLIPKDEVVRYRRKPRIAPNWYHSSTYVDEQIFRRSNAMTIRLFVGQFDWSRWETVAYLNLFK